MDLWKDQISSKNKQQQKKWRHKPPTSEWNNSKKKIGEYYKQVYTHKYSNLAKMNQLVISTNYHHSPNIKQILWIAQ